MVDINLLPQSVKFRRRRRLRMALVLVTVLVAAVGASYYYLLLEREIDATRAQLALLEEEYAAYREVLKARAHLNTLLEDLAQRRAAMTEAAPRWSGFIEGLGKVTEPDVVLTGLVASPGGEVTIAGEAARLESVASLLLELKTSLGAEVIEVTFPKRFDETNTPPRRVHFVVRAKFGEGTVDERPGSETD